MAQQAREPASDSLATPLFERVPLASVDLAASHLDEAEFQRLSDSQQRVQQRLNEVTTQGFGHALLLRPFSQKYRIYRYEVDDGLAVHGDIVLGNVRHVIRESISNRDAGITKGDAATVTPPNSPAPPPILDDARFRWPDGVVPYQIKNGDFSNSESALISQGIATLETNTNLTFRYKKSSDRDYIRFIAKPNLNGNGRAEVGRQSGKQKVWLNTGEEKPFSEATVVHELLHSVGFKHEQTRADRDSYIKVLWHNIEDSAKNNFEIDEVRTFGDYDYESIMHYWEGAFGFKCHISDYATNDRCGDCTIKREKKFLEDMAGNKACRKVTMRSTTGTKIAPGNVLTSLDIAAVNAAYPAKQSTTKVTSLSTLVTEPRTFTLTVEKLKRVAGDKGESGALCGKYPDFIGEIVVGDAKEIDTGHDKPGILIVNETHLSKTKRKHKQVGDTVKPNWTLDVPVAPNTEELYLIVKIWEYDDAACGGKNDLVDVSPQRDQAYLRLLVNLATGELQHLRPQPATAAGGVVYYERARYTGHTIFDPVSGEFLPATFSGLGDKSATEYQMEASVTIKASVKT